MAANPQPDSEIIDSDETLDLAVDSEAYRNDRKVPTPIESDKRDDGKNETGDSRDLGEGRSDFNVI